MEGTCLEITPKGLKGSQRHAKDGYTYFGAKTIGGDQENCYLKDTHNDFVIPTKETEGCK